MTPLCTTGSTAAHHGFLRYVTRLVVDGSRFLLAAQRILARAWQQTVRTYLDHAGEIPVGPRHENAQPVPRYSTLGVKSFKIIRHIT